MSDMYIQDTAGDASGSSGSSMSMTFFQATNTPLLFHGTAPATPGQYAGACIILALLAVVACAMINLKAVLQRSAWTPQPQPKHSKHSLLRDDEKTASNALIIVGLSAMKHGRLGPRWWWDGWNATTLTAGGMATFGIPLVGLGYFCSVMCFPSREAGIYRALTSIHSASGSSSAYLPVAKNLRSLSNLSPGGPRQLRFGLP